MNKLIERRAALIGEAKRSSLNVILEFSNTITSNGHSTRILIVEDSPADLLLIQHELRSEKIAHVEKCVETWPSFVQAISEFQPDLILSDHNLPGFDGLDALKYARQHCPEVPFIFVSGALGEEVAIQTLTNGATDYVLKDRMSRLAPAVQRALKESDGLRKRKRAEQALVEAEAKYRSIIENALHGIFRSVPDGRLLSANPAMARMLGYHNTEELLDNIADIGRQLWVLPDSYLELKRRLTQHGSVERFETQLYRKGGSKIWVNINIVAMKDGRDFYYDGILEDITDQKFAEHALRHSEDRFRSLFEAAPIGIALHNVDGKYVQANPAYQRMFGYTEQELQSFDLAQVVREDVEGEMAALLKVFQAGQRSICEREKRCVAKDGRAFWARISTSGVRDCDGNLSYIISMAEDIDAHKKEEIALKESRQYARDIISYSSDMIIVTDRDRKITEFNKAAEISFGYSREEILGKDASVLYAEPVVGAKNRRSLEENGELRTEVINVRKNGEIFLSSLSASVLSNDQGDFLGVTGISRDITESKKQEKMHKVFSNLSYLLSTATSHRESARMIVNLTDTLLGFDSCHLCLCDEEQNEISSIINVDTVAGQRINVSFGPLRTKVASTALLSGCGKAQRIAQKPSGTAAFSTQFREPQSVISVPIRNADRVIGIYTIGSAKPNAYDEEARETLQTLADLCGGALERITITDKLRESENKHKALIDAIPDCMFRIRRDGAILDFKIPKKSKSPDPEPIPPKALSELFSDEIVQRFMIGFNDALKANSVETFEFQVSLGEEICEYEGRIVASGENEGLIIIRDIAEQKRLEKEVLNISAVEQLRIGQDLHDSLGQDLTGIAFMARYLQETLAEQSKSEAMLAADIGKFISQAIKKVRAFSRDLLQPELDMSSLVPALTDLAANVSKMFKVSCQFKEPGKMREIPLNAAIHLYRIAQEAISNAIKHGKASQIVVSLLQTKQELTLNVFNNGSDYFGSVDASKGMGLRIMHYRARTIGATLDFHQVERGVQLTCCLPNNSIKI